MREGEAVVAVALHTRPARVSKWRTRFARRRRSWCISRDLGQHPDAPSPRRRELHLPLGGAGCNRYLREGLQSSGDVVRVDEGGRTSDTPVP